MTTKQKLAIELYRSVFSDTWHGASLKDILDSTNYKQAFTKPIKDAHSIIELTLHINAWTEEVFSRISGNPPSEPAAGDWPIPAGDSEQYWNSSKQSVYENANKLISSIENFSDEKLEERVGEERYAPLGTGLTFEGMVIGLIQHNAYHAGQISLLKK